VKVLVTGATGSLGRALIRRALTADKWTRCLPRCDVTRVAAFARSESRLAELTREFGHYDAFRPFLGDVRDEGRLRDACVGVDTVIHGAALKRVDDGAYNPLEMHKTNVEGSINVANAARAEGVKNVLLVSSDKAVAAINTYGGSKYQAENCLRELNAHSAPRGTRISCVRYGNVLASTGSVLTIWKRQHELGQPLTITDQRMTRFWMTMDHAVNHIFKALEIMRGGEIILPVMRSSTIKALAEAFKDVRDWSDCEIKTTGVRPGGEKSHESLLNDDEAERVIAQKDCLVIPPAVHSWTSEEWKTDHSVAVPRLYSSGSEEFCTYTHNCLLELLRRVL
jgi:UDP-N-acetylglucosamine 4,6-dehydratase